MKTVCLLVSMVAVCGCTFLNGKKTNSSWVVLEKAEDAACSAWPKQEQDLSVNELMLARGRVKAILSSGMKRDGSPNFYYALWKDETEFETAQLHELKLGRNSVLLGGALLSGKPVVDVVYNVQDKNGNAKATLEVRNVKDNLVRFKGALFSEAVVSGSVLAAGDVHWIVFKRDDGDYGVARLAFVKDKGTLMPIAGLTYKDLPVLMAAPGDKGEALVVAKEGDAKDDKPLKVRKLGSDGQAGNPLAVDMTIENGIESWTAAPYGTGYNLAIVDGDSLIGQAELKVAAFDWVDESVVTKWTKGIALRDVHVSDPVFLASAKGLQVLTLNWVDDESTIARYIVAGGTVGKPVYSGIFPKGSRIVDAFGGNDADETFAIMRHKDDTSWIFQLCRL